MMKYFVSFVLLIIVTQAVIQADKMDKVPVC